MITTNVTSSKHTCKDVKDEGLYTEPEAQEGYYIAYYFALTSKICIIYIQRGQNHDPMSMISVV